MSSLGGPCKSCARLTYTRLFGERACAKCIELFLELFERKWWKGYEAPHSLYERRKS